MTDDLPDELPNDLILRNPRPNARTIYHYCSSDTLYKILENKTLRISDLSKMNDSMELEWGLSIIKSEIESNSKSLGKSYCDALEEQINDSKQNYRFLIACFSEGGDILSQWRSYADDGKGYSIGFNYKDLAEHGAIANNVIYDELAQRAIVSGYLLKSANYWKNTDNIDFKEGVIRRSGINLIAQSCLFKNPAFKEEKEVRIVETISYYETNGAPNIRIIAAKGGAFEKCSSINVQIRGNFIVPYMDICIPDCESAMTDLFVGPKNQNNEFDIKVLFSSHNLTSPKIIRSRASYR